MYFQRSFLFVPLLLLSWVLSAQVPKDATLAVTATFTINPASIKLTWPNPSASGLVIYRHAKTSPNNVWLSLLNVTNSTQTTLTDNLVSPGQVYEYVVQRVVAGKPSYGYAHVAVNAAPIDNRGKLLFFVDSTLMGPLANEVGQLKLDMMGDGWTVVPHIIGSGATVQSMKSLIVADYNADPTNVKMVFLLGALPVPYAGDIKIIDASNHQGAWPADSYYADVNGVWTDATVNNTTPARAANDNVPGDGKFDQSVIPGNVELAVGRVDFRHLSPTTFGTSQIELYRRYLHKDHAWRMHEYTVENKAIIDDHYGYQLGEAFAANGFRNAYPLMPAANVVEGDFFESSKTGSYLLGMACGNGTYTGIDSVGSSTKFATDSVNVVFAMTFGLYHGDWDYETNPFMPAALASKGGILTCAWTGRPHMFYHALASGETIGYCTQETQNAIDNTGFLPSAGEGGTHVSLLGDPSLRAQVVAPPKDLVAAPQCGTVGLSWTAPTGPAPLGYYVYRSLVRNGTYTRLTASAITTTTFTDSMPPSDTLFYQVRALQVVTNPGGGTYINSSTGASAFLIFAPGNPPMLSTTNGTITCTAQEINLAVTASLPISGTPEWEGPGGVDYSGSTIVVNEPGSYTVTITATNGCTATATAQVSNNTTLPTFSGSGGTITCTNPSVTLHTGNTTAAASWSGPNGFTSTQLQPVVTAAGLYTVTLTAPGNGCTQTGDITVPIDTFVLPLTIPTLPTLTCVMLCINVILPAVPGHQLYVDGSLLAPGLPLGICSPGAHTLGLKSLANGCQDNYPVTINQNIMPPGATATGGTLNCNTPLQLQGSSATPDITYQWTGPGAFVSTQQNPSVTAVGTYTLTVKNPVNGCTSIDTAVVNGANFPTAIAIGDTLTCNHPTGTLHGDSPVPVAYSWVGPAGFASNERNPAISLPGNYLLVVTSLNGCTGSAATTVLVDTDPPSATASGGTITCNEPNVVLQSTAGASATYSWAGPNGFTSTEPNPTVTEAGIYILIVTGANGCSTMVSAAVTQALPLHFFPTTATVIDCAGNLTMGAEVIDGTPPYQYLWSTGDTTSLVTIPAGTATEVSVTVSDAAGCSVVSPSIQIPPFLPLEINAVIVDESGMTQNGSIILSVSGGVSGLYAYLWNTGATVPEIFNLSAGVYTVTVTNTVGCTAVASFTVNATSGIEDPTFWQLLRLSPNPAREEALVELRFPVATALQVKVVDATGRLLLALPETTLLEGSLPLDLRRCPPGMYTVLFSTKAGTAVRKLVVTRD